jgi:hypothetical protein
MEAAGTKYVADLYRPERTLSDFAYLGGPFLRKGASVLKFNYLEVGPSFYSPFAQIRQYSMSSVTGFPLLTTLGDPSGYFKTYDRTTDNTFPYGLATPNRKGFGLEWDMKGLKGQAFSFSAAAYRVKEIMGNLVVDSTYTYLVPIEDSTLTTPPLRTFTYVNVGPRLDLAKLLHRKRPLELGVNLRSEKTVSDLGTLNCSSVVPGLKVGVAAGWEWNLALRLIKAKGREAGLDGNLQARYSYWYDPTDRDHYTLQDTDTTYRTVFVSTSIAMGRNAKLSLDAWTASWKNKDVSDNSEREQYLGFMHEIQF